jgi:2-polyprenyl-3-methyl-5-hydroxy-6-metoxy-1,4-benzoquinol methylase
MSILGLRRRLVGELMDSPTLDPAAHQRALDGLRRINRASRTAERLAVPILAWAKRRRLTSLSMLDIACGGGDVPIGVATLAKQQGLAIHLTLSDRSPTAIHKAGAAAQDAGIPHHTQTEDAVAHAPAGTYDLVTNSLFLHHLTESEVIAALTHMRDAARRAVFVSDLRRSVLGYVIAWIGCRLLSDSPIVHYDGPVSVRAAWSVSELAAMARQAGMTGVEVRRAWPWRILLIWERPLEETSHAK